MPEQEVAIVVDRGVVTDVFTSDPKCIVTVIDNDMIITEEQRTATRDGLVENVIKRGLHKVF